MAFKKRSKFKQYLYSPITSGLLCLVALFLGINVYERYEVASDMSNRASDIAVELDHLQERQQQLQERVEYLADDRGREAEIRKHFDVAREGERVVIIVDDEVQSAVAGASTTEFDAEESRPWYKFW